MSKKEYWHEYYKKNRKKRLANAERSRLKNTYGLTEQSYKNMFVSQDYRCAICNTHQDEIHRKLHVDHCHESGKVRGLLCNDCNRGLGSFKDDLGRMTAAIRYLENSK
jgi:hypothetical protein